MKALSHTVVFVTLLLAPTLLPGQVSRRDLEGIEAHRNAPRPSGPAISSVGDPDTVSRRRTKSILETWDFLTEDEKGQETDEDRVVITAEEPLKEETVEERLLSLPQELMIPYRTEILDHVEDYMYTHRNALRGILGKYRYREAALRGAFRAQGLPEELSVLAIVESAMNPRALSHAGALGLWQLMPETARLLGLECNDRIDERLDVDKATAAAVRYLKKAYERYRSWPLAIASYNCGIRNTDRAIIEADSGNWWEVYRFLPMETREYVPYFIAALYAVNYHDRHGITERKYSEPRYATFRINRELSYTEIMQTVNVSLGELQTANPQYLRGYIPGTKKKGYILRIPKKYAKEFKNNFKS